MNDKHSIDGDGSLESQKKAEYLDSISDNIREKVRQGHIADEAAHRVVCNYKPFWITLKDNDNEITGVLSAYTAYSEIYVDDIWVDLKYRKKGVGRKLLEILENHFSGKGYNNINLVTSQFQAPDFYKKCGFEIEFVRENTHNPALTKIFFIKYFNDSIQSQGMLK